MARESVRTILLLGAGRMGGSMLTGWLADPDAAYRVIAVDPKPSGDLERLAGEGRIELNPDLAAFGETPPDLTILAVKPQLMDEAVPAIRPIAAAGGPMLSIAAGRSIGSIAAALQATPPIVRAMPNTPASIGRGATVCVPGEGVSRELRDLCESLLGVVGEVFWLEDEGLLDAVTALSGSGPAYVFHLAECMADAGRAVGLPPDLADELARLTVGGGGEMLWRGEYDPGTLREQVTSPGGTTAAALEVLRDSGALKDLMIRAVTAARDRGRALDQS